MSLSGKKILLGVTGGIAAYKSAALLREFQKSGAELRVTMTPSATRFVGTETFSTLSRTAVAVEVFSGNDTDDSWTRHIHWGEWADLMVIAPCTANTLSKLVHGQADNMLTSIALAARCPILLCPTMDAGMIEHPAVRENLELADEYGFHVMQPDEGYLASGLEGAGRLPELKEIVDKSEEIIEKQRSGGPLHKKKVLVTAGPTREHIDPVRYISNPSSGKMGFAMAEAARNLGGDVILLCGPVAQDPPEGVQVEKFDSADQLFSLVQKHADADVVIAAAAVADYKPAETAGQKHKKESGSPSVDLTETPDSLAWLGSRRRDDQTLIGFAMETENLESNARRKLEAKNLDWICANDLTGEDAGFASDQNRILLIGKDSISEFEGEKRQIARQILNTIFGEMSNSEDSFEMNRF